MQGLSIETQGSTQVMFLRTNSDNDLLEGRLVLLENITITHSIVDNQESNDFVSEFSMFLAQDLEMNNVTFEDYSGAFIDSKISIVLNRSRVLFNRRKQLNLNFTSINLTNRQSDQAMHDLQLIRIYENIPLRRIALTKVQISLNSIKVMRTSSSLNSFMEIYTYSYSTILVNDIQFINSTSAGNLLQIEAPIIKIDSLYILNSGFQKTPLVSLSTNYYTAIKAVSIVNTTSANFIKIHSQENSRVEISNITIRDCSVTDITGLMHFIGETDGTFSVSEAKFDNIELGPYTDLINLSSLKVAEFIDINLNSVYPSYVEVQNQTYEISDTQKEPHDFDYHMINYFSIGNSIITDETPLTTDSVNISFTNINVENSGVAIFRKKTHQNQVGSFQMFQGRNISY